MALAGATFPSGDLRRKVDRTSSPSAISRVLAMSVGAAISFMLVLTLWAPTAGAQVDATPRNSDGVSGLDSISPIREPRSPIFALEQIGNRIYVGGRFQQVERSGASSVSQAYLAAFDASTGAWISSFRPNLNAPVWSLEATPDGQHLLVGGRFTNVNGSSRQAFASLNPTSGALDSYPLRITGPSTAVVREVHVDTDGFVYLGGFFTNASDNSGSLVVSSILRANANSGGIDRSWRPRAQGGTVRGIDADAGRNRVYLVGYFDSINGSANTADFAVVNHSGGATANINNPFPRRSPEGLVNTVFHYQVLASGNFVWVAGTEHTLWILNANDLSVFGWHYTGDAGARVGGFGGDFQAIERVGNIVYASCHCGADIKSSFTGGFNGTSTQVRFGMAFDANNGRFLPGFAPEFRGAAGPWAIKATSDGCVWFGGDMTQAGGRGVSSLARLCNGTPPPVGGGGGAAVAPTSCTATGTGDSTINVSWNRASNDNATAFAVERSRNGGTYFWAGRTSSTSFTNTGVRSGTYRYRVVAVASNGSRATRTCNPTGGVTIGGGQANAGPVRAVASCYVRRSNGNAIITWTRSDRDNATTFVVERSRNGGTFFWAGRTDVNTTSFTNQSPPRGSFAYRVVAVGAGGRETRTCGSAAGGTITF